MTTIECLLHIPPVWGQVTAMTTFRDTIVAVTNTGRVLAITTDVWGQIRWVDEVKPMRLMPSPI
jgi:hypothetical protein